MYKRQIWDRLFGTFSEEVREKDKPNFGIVKNVATFNPFRLAVHEWVAIFKDVRGARSVKEALNFMFNVPGWSPDGSRRTSEMIRSEWREEKAEAAALPAE